MVGWVADCTFKSDGFNEMVALSCSERVKLFRLNLRDIFVENLIHPKWDIIYSRIS